MHMEEAAKPPIFEGFRAGCNVVLHGRRGTLWHSHVSEKMPKVVLLDKRNTSARFSEYDLHFSWHAQHFGRVHLHSAWQAQHFRHVVPRVFGESYFRAVSGGDSMQIAWDIVRVSFCVTGTEFGEDPSCVECDFFLHGRGSIWDTLHFTLDTPLFTFYTSHTSLYTPHSTLVLYTLHFTLETPHSTLYTWQFTLHTLHFTLHTLNFTLNT